MANQASPAAVEQSLVLPKQTGSSSGGQMLQAPWNECEHSARGAAELNSCSSTSSSSSSSWGHQELGRDRDSRLGSQRMMFEDKDDAFAVMFFNIQDFGGLSHKWGVDFSTSKMVSPPSIPPSLHFFLLLLHSFFIFLIFPWPGGSWGLGFVTSQIPACPPHLPAHGSQFSPNGKRP